MRLLSSQNLVPAVINRSFVSEKKPINMMGMLSMFDDCISKKVTEHFPFNWSKLVAKFLQFPNHRIYVVVTEKQVNHCAVFGLEIPIDYIFTQTLE